MYYYQLISGIIISSKEKAKIDPKYYALLLKDATIRHPLTPNTPEQIANLRFYTKYIIAEWEKDEV